ncbi:hypothetical protein SAMN04487995_0662 [Dyadobacter koreensis]|uniref:Uncharacterized protein n=1 Tax=Dyadobacter koreensis TaxID=408657 RepID=A0A1H6QMB8_9BACT|nr:hypothetical protein [Dyadobacter koreensis]SEI43096.1 hypothetical protein SAMN04487995_0662 [Dyadobacter koreensis]
MENEQEEIFRKLIQKAGLEKTHADFTSEVMKNIQIETELEFAREARLKMIISDIEQDSAPPLFQKNVMAQITLTKKLEVEPIISRKVWYLVGAAAVLIFIFCFVSPSGGTPENIPYFSTSLKVVVSDFSGKIGVLPIIYPAVIFALALLIMGDYLFRSKMAGS